MRMIVLGAVMALFIGLTPAGAAIPPGGDVHR